MCATQALAFGMLAALVMRLKLFATPLAIVLAAIALSSQVGAPPPNQRKKLTLCSTWVPSKEAFSTRDLPLDIFAFQLWMSAFSSLTFFKPRKLWLRHRHAAAVAVAVIAGERRL